MTFKEWLFSSFPNPKVNGAWGWRHILTLVVCIAAIIFFTLLFNKKSDKSKRILIMVLSICVLVLEIVRRTIRILKPGRSLETISIIRTLLPRPWCAIACWSIILAMFIRKKNYYNFVSMFALVGAMSFFLFPMVGFNNKYMLFENIYSITSHSFLLVISVLYMTLGFTEFRYKSIWKEGICLLIVIVYVIAQMHLNIHPDPMYFAVNNEIQTTLGLPYYIYLPLYIIILLIYFNIFYLIGDRKNVFHKRRLKSSGSAV